MPAAFAANANLFVSAENSQFDNYMSGPQVIEVVIIDSDINDTDEAKGEPDVTINGKILRMVQAVDGNWYGYFADRNMADIADATTTAPGIGLDFGIRCDNQDTTSNGGETVDFTDTVGFYANVAGCTDDGNTDNLAGTTITSPAINNVVREAKDVNTQIGPDGQIGMSVSAWPVIQLYPLNPTGNVVVQYNKGGGAQTTTLTFDTVDQFAGAELDRASYTRGSQVHATITDLWLNIDPTDEDSWTFGTTGTSFAANATTNYQVFDENGNQSGDGNGSVNITSALDDLMCEDNCRLLTTVDSQDKGFVITLADNDDSEIRPTLGSPASPFSWATLGGLESGNVPITMTEQGPNSGIFGSYDESDQSSVVITRTADRGTSATFDYNETPRTILVSLSFGSIDIEVTDDEWNSGEEVPVTLVDADANRNSRADEDLDLFNPDVALIPSLRTGDPFTLAENDDNDGAVLKALYANLTTPGNVTAGLTGNDTASVSVEKFSKRGIVTSASVTTTAGAILVDLEANGADLRQSVKTGATFSGFNFYNQDVRSFTGGNTNVSILYGANPFTSPTTASVINIGTVGAQSLTDISGLTSAINAIGATQKLALLIEFNGATNVGPREAFVSDFFSFGFEDDGVETAERVANQIIRLELEETGDNTSTFEGTLEYVMVNQLNILESQTYAGLTTIADDPTFIVIEDLTDEDAPRVNYLDVGADGVATQVSDQEEAPSHSGIVSFDNDSYKIADTVTI
jgi:hypothetical protein